MKYIAVLMTVYNRKKETLQCLENLYSQELSADIRMHVYLTNDGCTDGTPDAIKKQYPEVNIINGSGNLYWNRGMYVAWVEAAKKDYDFYLWLNDDTYLYQNSIKRLLEESSVNKDKAIIVGSTCAVGNQTCITYGGWSKKGLITNVDTPVVCETINGNIVLIPRAAYQKLGTNDPRLHHHGGDTDYGLRAKENGVPCYTGIGIFGECNQHASIAVWKDPSKPFLKRWKHFMSPLGANPFDFFYEKRKHEGLIKACFYFCTNWIHFLFPSLWNKFRN